MQDDRLRNPPSVKAGSLVKTRPGLFRGGDGSRRSMTDTERKACGVTACQLATRQVAVNGVEPSDVQFLMACDIRERLRIHTRTRAQLPVPGSATPLGHSAGPPHWATPLGHGR